MFKRSKRKIVGSIMGILALLFAGTLCVIYFSSYYEVLERDKQMLSRYTKAYWLHGNPEGQREEKTFHLQTFYSVAFSAEGEVLGIDNEDLPDIADEELVKLAQELVKKGRSDGICRDWIYHVEENEGMTLVSLMDKSIMNSNMDTLFQYTLVFGSIAMVLLFFMSLYLAGRIVRPLEESYQKQKQFISDASHELKTPIAAVHANAELLEREFGQSKWLDNIQMENQRMGELVRELLELARTENTRPQMEKLDFSRVVMGSVLSLEGIAFEKACGLESQIQDDLFVRGNPEQLERLVMILLDNALEYAPDHSVINVVLKAEKGQILLSVANEGEAIPEDIRKNLFERFYRADESRQGENGHYGLGLAIAKSIVTAHQGKIEVECTGNQVIFMVRFSRCS